MFYKPEIRRKLRARRHQLDHESIVHAADQAAAQLIYLPEFIESNTAAFYLSQENELDTMPSIRCALDLNKQLFLPVVPASEDKLLQFYSYHPDDKLIDNRYDIPEPNTKEQTAIETAALDIIFLPLVAFDEACNRLGRGAGYYDYTLAFTKTTTKRPLLIGLAYEFQKIPSIEPDKWDVPMDMIITEAATYRRA